MEDLELQVTHVWYDGGTLAYGEGTTDDGRHLVFAGEPRYLSDIAVALSSLPTDGSVRASVPAWAIL